MMVRKVFDAKCYELAKAFLSDEPTLDSEESRADLAQDIQNTIEGLDRGPAPKERCNHARGITAGLKRASSIPAAPASQPVAPWQDAMRLLVSSLRVAVSSWTIQSVARNMCRSVLRVYKTSPRTQSRERTGSPPHSPGADTVDGTDKLNWQFVLSAATPHRDSASSALAPKEGK